MLAAQLARLGRRSGVWLLTAVLVVLNVLVARHNVEGVRTARADLASASAGRIVRNCVVYGGYVPVTTCTPQVVPLVYPVPTTKTSDSKRSAQVWNCTATGCIASPVPGQAPAGVTYVIQGPGPLACPAASCASGHGGRLAIGMNVTQRQEREQIQQAVRVSSQSLDTAAGDIAPRQRIRLALSLLASLPGLTLAVLLGAVASGRDYRRMTWRARLDLARSRPGALTARLAALWLVTLGWIAAGVIATLVSYAVLARGAHLAAWGLPAIPLPALLGTWLSVSLLASLATAVSAAPRPASPALVGGLAHPMPEALAEHD